MMADLNGPIVVPLDGSELAQGVMPHAIAIARRTRAPLHLVTVHQPTPAAARDGFDPTYDPRWYAATAAGQRKYLEEIAGRLSGEEFPVIVAVLDGPVVPALLGYAAVEQRAALLVMSTHGRGGLNRLWLGSTLDRILRETSLPILVIRAGVETEGEPSIRRMLIPLDGSELAEQVLPAAVALGTAFGCAFDLVRLVPLPYTIGSGLMAHSVRLDEEGLRNRLREAEDDLSEVSRRLREREGIEVSTHVLEAPGQGIPEAILEAAAAFRADTIALATHARGGVRRAVLGSIADKLIRSAELPLLVVRPGSE